MTDRLCLLKADGSRFENIPACISGNGILVGDVTLPIEPGDRFSRTLPNGLAEEFIVDDPRYCAAISGLAAHFQVKMHKAGALDSKSQSVNYNVTGPNARVNISSHDHSTNSVTYNDAALFSELRQAIESVHDQDNRASLLSDLEAMRMAQGKPDFGAQYSKFISTAADYMSIVGPFLPALAKLFG